MRMIALTMIISLAVTSCSTQKKAQKSPVESEVSNDMAKTQKKSALSDKELGKLRVHTVAEGETLSIIAADYGVELEDLIMLNEIEDVDFIVVGQKLYIPNAENN